MRNVVAMYSWGKVHDHKRHKLCTVAGGKNQSGQCSTVANDESRKGRSKIDDQVSARLCDNWGLIA